MAKQHDIRFYPGMGWRGFINGKPVTGFYDTEEKRELELKMNELSTRVEQNTKHERPEPISLLDFIKQKDPEFYKQHEEWKKKKSE